MTNRKKIVGNRDSAIRPRPDVMDMEFDILIVAGRAATNATSVAVPFENFHPHLWRRRASERGFRNYVESGSSDINARGRMALEDILEVLFSNRGSYECVSAHEIEDRQF
jgi:hypothetical protein